jgi:small subunit ribosomal protein S3
VGHKTHPLGFRLGITKKHFSSWFSELNKYSIFLEEDFKIRTHILKFLEAENIKNHGISKIIVSRKMEDPIKLEIHTVFPGIIVGTSGKSLEKLNFSFEKLFQKKKKISISIIEINQPYREANLVADYISDQLEKRISFKRAVKSAIELAQIKGKVDGIKVQVSGRLNGAEIARSEWNREGRVPLQTLRADIDYSSKTVLTVYGILGIKVWLFKGEIFNQSKSADPDFQN